jgi:hypothetical protein
MAKTRGSVITLKIGGTLFQGLVSKNFSGTTELEDATSQDSANVKVHNPGDISWTVGFKSLLDPTHTQGVQEVLAAWKAKTQVVVLIEGTVSGEPTITGTGTISSCTLNADHGSTVSCDGTITGNSDVTFGEV